MFPQILKILSHYPSPISDQFRPGHALYVGSSPCGADRSKAMAVVLHGLGLKRYMEMYIVLNMGIDSVFCPMKNGDFAIAMLVYREGNQ